MTDRQSNAFKAIESAWDFWLSQHDISVPDIIEVAITKAFREWLDANGDELFKEAVKEVIHLPEGTWTQEQLRAILNPKKEETSTS